MKIHSIITHLLLAASLIACQDNPSEPIPSPSVPTQGTPTETGQPTGPKISKIIGPGGGNISTPDNVFKMVIPAGALPGDTIGPLSVSILEYDRANRRVKGKISGTLHYYDEKTNRHESMQVSARFDAASPY